jgi:L-lactate utilization protein LutC
MTNFDEKFFKKVDFSKDDIKRYFDSSCRDVKISQEDEHTEVRFTYAYQALIKLGIVLLASEGVRVRSIPGHHIKILEELSRILSNPDISIMGNRMRKKRNQDLYSGGEFISKKEADESVEFVESVLLAVKKQLNL